MPKYKLKTHKATAKRFHITGTGKLMHTKGMKSHLRRKKSARTKRMFGEMFQTTGGNVSRIKKLIPYGA